MTDLTSETAPQPTPAVLNGAPPAIPIQVADDPNKEGNAAILRIALTAAGSIALSLGAAKVSTILAVLSGQTANIMIVAGAVTALSAGVVGWLKTKSNATKGAAMAKFLPNAYATTKT